MDEKQLRAKLTELAELINAVLPVGEEQMEAPPDQWCQLNELTRDVADGTQRCADYWREVASRSGR